MAALLFWKIYFRSSLISDVWPICIRDGLKWLGTELHSLATDDYLALAAVATVHAR